MEKKLKKFVLEELPPDGIWWDIENADPFIVLALHLEDNGQQSFEYIKDLLQKAYSAVADEFGS